MKTRKKNLRKQTCEHFKELAKVIAINHINSSVGIIDEAEKFERTHKELKEILESHVLNQELKYSEIRGQKNWKRIILIVGAGASYNAFKNIKLGRQATESIYRNFNFGIDFWDVINSELNTNLNGIKAIKEKFLKEKNILSLYNKDRFKNNEIDFETALVLLSKFFPSSKLREIIVQLYSFRHGPTLFHDIISHLLKHRFIDIVINFNFDELLDQCIEDELGAKYYDSILSDGDIKEMETYLIDKRLKKPIYIKPHGTFSHKSSLRFTKNHYDLMPIDMKNFLQKVITCSQDYGYATSSVLIIIGFALESVELDDILSKVTNDTDIYYFSYGYDKNVIKRLRRKIRKINNRINLKIINTKLLWSNTRLNHEFDNIFEDLWNEVNTHF